MSVPAYPEYKDSGIPSHWTQGKLKWRARVYSGSDAKADNGATPLFGANGVIGQAEDASHIRDRVLVGRVGSAGAITFAPAPFAVSDNALVVEHDDTLACPRFLFHALSCADFSIDISKTAQPLLTGSQVKDWPFAFPPTEEQSAIAAFLDRETGKIDTLVAEQETLIGLLKEKRQAVISHAVTKGLDPTAPMKDSGIEWLGAVPAHWEVVPLTKYVIEQVDYRGKTPTKVDDGVFLVTAKNVRMGFIDYEGSQEFVSHEEYADIMRRGLPRTGDILFTMEAPLGNMALVDREDVALAQRIILFRMKIDFLLPSFTLNSMMSEFFQSQLRSLSTGSTAEGLKASKLHILRVVAPPLEEQEEIAKYLADAATQMDSLIAEAQRGIDLLKERRSALISAAVTGKIDVRGLVMAEAA